MALELVVPGWPAQASGEELLPDCDLEVVVVYNRGAYE